MQDILTGSVKLIEIIEKEKLSLTNFLKKYSDLFTGMNTGTLIAQEYRMKGEFSEKSYVFLVGSYIYYLVERKPVIWLERRRYARFTHYEELFQRTLSSDPLRRFTSLYELKAYLLEMQKEL